MFLLLPAPVYSQPLKWILWNLHISPLPKWILWNLHVPPLPKWILWNLHIPPLSAFFLMGQVSSLLFGLFRETASSLHFCTPLILMEFNVLGTELYVALHVNQSHGDGLRFPSFLLEIAHPKYLRSK